MKKTVKNIKLASIVIYLLRKGVSPWPLHEFSPEEVCTVEFHGTTLQIKASEGIYYFDICEKLSWMDLSLEAETDKRFAAVEL